MFKLKNYLKITQFVLLMSVLNFLFFHLPFFSFVFKNIDYKSLNGIVLVLSLVILMLVLNAFVLYLIFFLSRLVGKILLIFFFIGSSIAVYFINTYSVIIDETMVGNILNTNYSESSSFFSIKLILYVVLLGILPSIYIAKVKIENVKLKRFLITSALSLLFIIILIFANASNWLWIDKNSKTLGGLAMPWSYTVNFTRFYIHQQQENKKEILLPDAKIMDNKKAVVVLVIGESARSQNFSLYGYKKNTNPLLSKIPNLHHFEATSCSTYTTAGVKCILEHKNSGDLYEILPNYLFRNDVDVVWRTSNWGEPPVHIKDYKKTEQLTSNCQGEGCSYDEALLAGLKEQILASKKDKIFIVLHTSTSHGPTYSKKYPAQFEMFKPVCNSVELGKCSKEELVNAYDNTIVYTDYILNRLIEDLKELKQYQSAMLFVSDHGESLGENNLYMHGLPMSIAPKEQYDIPFIVWVSDPAKELKPNKILTQNHVFHSVLNFLNIQSPIYDESMDIFK
ncbi:phosphoethanolamine--lipid A transferase EptA [Sphingobacterium ginsenosidimutans]